MKKILIISLLFLSICALGQVGRYPFYKVTEVDYEFEVDRYMEGLSTPLNSTYKTAINKYVKRLKDSLEIDSLPEFFDVMVITANQTSEAGLRNLTERDHDATNSSMDFTAGYGFWGDATNKHLKTNYIPTADSVNFGKNDASLGLFVMTDMPIDVVGVDFGANNSYRTYFYVRTNQVTLNCLNTNTSTGTFIGDVIYGKGMYIMTRGSFGNQKMYKDGELLADQSVNAAGVSEGEFYVGARNESSSPTYPCPREYGMYFIAKNVTEAQQAIISRAFYAYLDDIGSSIIPTTISTSPSDFSAQQGYSWDGTYHYLIDDANHFVYKKNNDATWSTVGDSVNFFASTALDKGGDGDYYNGKLYLVGHTISGRTNQSILTVDAATMTLDSIHDISGDVAALSNLGGLTVDPDEGTNGIIYIVNFDENTSIYQFDLLDFDYIGALTLPHTITGMQGITTKGEWFYITSHAGSTETIYKVKKDMSKMDIIITSVGTGELEGIDYSTSYLRYGKLVGSKQRITFLQLYDQE